MTKFKPGDLVTIGDNKSAVYTVEPPNFVQAWAMEKKINGRGAPEIRINGQHYWASGKHVFGSSPDLKRYDPSPQLPSTPLDVAYRQTLANGVKVENMTKAEYQEFVRKTFDDMLALIKRKNADYTGPGDDPFANFRRASAVGVNPINGLAVRFLDKVARIESFLQAGKLENESFEDAWLDVIGYACLALGMIKERNDKLSEGKW